MDLLVTSSLKHDVHVLTQLDENGTGPMVALGIFVEIRLECMMNVRRTDTAALKCSLFQEMNEPARDPNPNSLFVHKPLACIA